MSTFRCLFDAEGWVTKYIWDDMPTEDGEVEVTADEFNLLLEGEATHRLVNNVVVPAPRRVEVRSDENERYYQAGLELDTDTVLETLRALTPAGVQTVISNMTTLDEIKPFVIAMCKLYAAKNFN